MKSMFTLVVLSFLLTACSRRDTQLSQQIAGTWTRESTNTQVFAPDGSYSFIFRKAGRTDSFAGTWKIEDRVLIMTLTNASNPKVSPLIGGVERYNIIRVDDHQLVYEESGQTNILTR